MCCCFNYIYLDISLTTPPGDAFLKYLSTLYVFVTYPSHNEGTLHTARQRIISNKSLFQHASHIGLPAYIQAKPFTSKDWHPPNFFLDQLSRVPDNKPTQNSTPGDNIEDSQAMGVTESPIDPPTERSSLQCEPTTAPVVTEKPNKKNKKRLEDTHWLGDKVILLQFLDLSHFEHFLLCIGCRRCCGGHHRSCVHNRGA